MNRIFVSYNMLDRSVARAVLQTWAEQVGEPIDIHDPAFRGASDQIARDVIRESIESSDSFVVVWTRRAAASPWVLYEMGLAHALDKPITVLLAGGDSAAIPRELGDVRVVDLVQRERRAPRVVAEARGTYGNAMPKAARRIAARKRVRERIRQRIAGKGGQPRLAVFQSLKSIYAQVIDDASGETIVSASSLEKGAITKGTNAAAAKAVGELIARKARDKGITRVVFNRGGYLYHGKIKALADAARENGLEF